MRDEFLKHQCPGQERRRLSEATEKTVRRSFLCLGFIMSQSVIVSRTVCLFCRAECVVSVVVVCTIKITCPHCSHYFCNVYHFAPLAKCVWQSFGAVNGSGPSASESRFEWCWTAWLAGLRWISDTLGLDDAICWAAKGSPE